MFTQTRKDQLAAAVEIGPHCIIDVFVAALAEGELDAVLYIAEAYEKFTNPASFAQDITNEMKQHGWID
jgi:hypothetical protein